MWVQLPAYMPSNPDSKVDDYDNLLSENLKHMTGWGIAPVVNVSDEECDLRCSEADEVSEPISLLEFKFHVHNSGLTNSPTVKIDFNLAYDLEEYGNQYNLKLKSILETSEIMADGSTAT